MVTALQEEANSGVLKGISLYLDMPVSKMYKTLHNILHCYAQKTTHVQGCSILISKQDTLSSKISRLHGKWTTDGHGTIYGQAE